MNALIQYFILFSDIYIEGMWLRYVQKFSRNGFTCAFTTLGFLLRMKRSVIGLFGRSSALIGCFIARLNVELCSDWLFHSAAQCWALLWLAISQSGSMLSSALIGCFTARLNVELCSDWLFHSASQCWALLWLAVSQRGSMLSSALIGCFTVRLNVELCSDWLFHSASQCWALLWLAISQSGSMLSSALIGCFTVRLNVELCSDWLFHSAAHFSNSQEGNAGRKIYISILSRAVISSGNYTVNKMRASGSRY